MNASLLQRPEVIKQLKQHVIKEVDSSASPLKKWERIKKAITTTMKEISRNIASTDKLVIAQLSEKVAEWEDSLPLNKEENDLYQRTKADLDLKLDEQIKAIIFRGRVKWNYEGKMSSKYFFGLERSRAMTKSCARILRDDGTYAETMPEILTEQFNFYKQLYTSNPNVHFNIMNEGAPKIPQEMKIKFNSLLTSQELTDAVMHMADGKTPGPDGLPAEVYKVLWPDIRNTFEELVSEIYQSRTLHTSAKCGILNLIPKSNKDSRLLKNLRPITLLNTDYKIIENALASRLALGLAEVVDHDQTGFMKQRRISVNVRRVFELMEICKRENINAFVFDLDYLKAFDMCEFTSITDSLKYFDFPDYIINWINVLYDGFTVKIQNLGHLSDSIDIQRSVHQGGCASSFLFNLCVETLAIENS